MEDKNIISQITPDSLRQEYLTPDKCVFSTGARGFLSAEIDGTQHGRVVLTCALPLTQNEDYICVSDVNGNELGILEHVADFPPAQQELIRQELSFRYYCPEITQINSVKEKMGHFFFEVTLGNVKKSFTVRDITKSVRRVLDFIDITDVDGNRYRIKNFDKIDRSSRRKLEPYIY